MVRSGLLETLPDDSVRAPRCYATEVVDGTNWLWLELVDEVPGRWGADDFVHVARRLGRFNGRFLEPRTPSPDPSWSRDLLRTWCEMLPPSDAWEHPTVSRFFSPALRQRVEQLWDARTSLFDALEHLPQTFVHADAHRRNLLLGKDPRSVPILIDWALCGIGPVGSDLSALVAGSAILQELDVDQVAAIEADASAAYSAGLADGGCTLDPRLVRLGWTAWTGLWFGTTLPALAAHWTSPPDVEEVEDLYGCTPDKLANRWARLCDHTVGRGLDAVGLLTEA